MKKILLEATVVSIMFVSFVVPSVLAVPIGPYTYDYPEDGGGEYGEYVTAGIGANLGPYGIDYGGWYAGRTLGGAQGFNGLLWFQFYYNSAQYQQYYTNETEYVVGSSIPLTNYVATRAWSGFYDSELESWIHYAFICIDVS
jgi:hypothetical protein